MILGWVRVECSLSCLPILTVHVITLLYADETPEHFLTVILPWVQEQEGGADNGVSKVLATYHKWVKSVEEHGGAPINSKNNEGGVPCMKADRSMALQKYVPFPLMRRKCVCCRCPIGCEPVPCSLRNAKDCLARKYARWFVGQHTHGLEIKLRAGCGEDISTAPLDHHPIFTHPSAHA